MSTIIDSLLVTLKLDNSDFEKKRKKTDKGLEQTRAEAEKTGKEFHSTGKKGAEGFTALSKSALKFFALLGGAVAVKNFVRETLLSSSALYRLSRNLNESAETVSAWSNATEIAGGSASGLQGTMLMLSRAQTDLRLTGRSGLIPYFSMLGISLAGANGKARKTSDILLDLAGRFHQMSAEGHRREAFNVGAMMGIPPGVMNLLLRGRKAIGDMLRQQKQLGAVTDHQAKIWEQFREKIVRFKQELKGLGYEFLSFLNDSVVLGIKDMKALGGMFKSLADQFPHLEALFKAMGNTIKNFAMGAVENLWKGLKEDVRWLLKLMGVMGKFAAIPLLNMLDRMAGNAGFGNKDTSAPLVFRFPRGIMNNNPGNLNFAGQKGAHSSGRYAAFGSMKEGVAALVRQIGLYIHRGKDTIRKIITTYAPPGENNTAAYIRAVSQFMGVSPDQPLSMGNAKQIEALVRAISIHENGGKYLSDDTVNAGYQMAVGAGATSRFGGSSPVTNNNSNQTTIGTVNIQTQAKDAKGILSDMSHSMDYLYISNANGAVF